MDASLRCRSGTSASQPRPCTASEPPGRSSRRVASSLAFAAAPSRSLRRRRAPVNASIIGEGEDLGEDVEEERRAEVREEEVQGQIANKDITKGKMVLDQSQGFMKQRKPGDGRKQARQKWEPPSENVVKLNVDGAFSCDDRAGVGMIGRDHQGIVVFAACRPLRHCKDATEVEVAAIEEGMRLALQWTQLSFIIESDCSEAVELINGAAPNISAYAFRVNVIRDMLRERESKLVKISREANRASHELAQLGRIQGQTEFWLGVSPPRQLWEH